MKYIVTSRIFILITITLIYMISCTNEEYTMRQIKDAKDRLEDSKNQDRIRKQKIVDNISEYTENNKYRIYKMGINKLGAWCKVRNMSNNCLLLFENELIRQTAKQKGFTFPIENRDSMKDGDYSIIIADSVENTKTTQIVTIKFTNSKVRVPRVKN